MNRHRIAGRPFALAAAVDAAHANGAVDERLCLGHFDDDGGCLVARDDAEACRQIPLIGGGVLDGRHADADAGLTLAVVGLRDDGARCHRQVVDRNQLVAIVAALAVVERAHSERSALEGPVDVNGDGLRAVARHYRHALRQYPFISGGVFHGLDRIDHARFALAYYVGALDLERRAGQRHYCHRGHGVHRFGRATVGVHHTAQIEVGGGGGRHCLCGHVGLFARHGVGHLLVFADVGYGAGHLHAVQQIVVRQRIGSRAALDAEGQVGLLALADGACAGHGDARQIVCHYGGRALEVGVGGRAVAVRNRNHVQTDGAGRFGRVFEDVWCLVRSQVEVHRAVGHHKAPRCARCRRQVDADGGRAAVAERVVAVDIRCRARTHGHYGGLGAEGQPLC